MVEFPASTKNRTLERAGIATLTFYAAFTGGKFRPVPIFTKLHALTLVARSYALLVQVVKKNGNKKVSM